MNRNGPSQPQKHLPHPSALFVGHRGTKSTPDEGLPWEGIGRHNRVKTVAAATCLSLQATCEGPKDFLYRSLAQIVLPKA